MQGPPPLTGLKVIEFAGLAPGPFAGLLLADAGASVLRIDRPSPPPPPPPSSSSPSSSSSSSSPSSPSKQPAPGPPTSDALTRHKTSIAVNLKSPAGRALILQLARTADILIDPFRPGVLEKLHLGPETLCDPSSGNPRLIYARMTGFRRDGRYSAMAGHDINYLAVSGVLALLGREGQPPTPPLNILGDFAGGGAVLFQGILLALLARGVTGRGQVVEANMVDGANYLATFPRLGLKTAAWSGPRGTNLLDTGAPFYDTYETRHVEGEKKKQYMAVGALEPQFYARLLKGLGLEGQGWEARRNDRNSWAEMRSVFGRVFKTKTRAEWEAVFDGTDACCTPVLEYAELEEAHTRRKEKGPAQGTSTSTREGDQRPAVTLRNTPLLAVDTSGGGEGGGAAADSRDASLGQGPGVEGDGYVARLLAPGEGGQETLKNWLGWQKGTHFDVDEDGGYVLKTVSKL